MGDITFLVGGARSGKSGLAVRLGQRHALGEGASVVYLATAEAFDDDLAARIERHREERPEWPTVEEPLHLADAVAALDPAAMVIVDCLTVWLANLSFHIAPAGQRLAMQRSFLAALRNRRGPAVVISNEVGLGIVPADASTREYRDDLGRLNQEVAAAATTTLLLVAGRAVRLHDPQELLP